MGSRIVFLGTAGDSLTAGKQIYASGGIIVSHNDMLLLLNPSPGTVVRTKQHGFSAREIDAILVSSNNLLDAGDLNATVDAMTGGGLDKKGVVVCNVSVVDGNDQFHPSLSPFHSQCVEKILPLKIGDKVALNDIEIYPTATSHPEDTHIGYKIVTDKFIMSYLGDSAFEKHIVKDHKGSEILILNMPNPDTKKKTTTTLDDAIRFIKEIKPKLAIITRFGIKMMENEILDYVRTIQKQSGVQTISAKDGLVVNPTSYAAVLRQRKLV